MHFLRSDSYPIVKSPGLNALRNTFETDLNPIPQTTSGGDLRRIPDETGQEYDDALEHASPQMSNCIKPTCKLSQIKVKTQFLATFRMVKWDYDWSDRMEMMITANSDNNGNISDAEVRRSVPVQFAVDLAISLVAEESVTYLNFSLEDRGPKPLNIVYKVENLALKGLPVSLKLTLPCQTTHVILTPQNFRMQENSVPCGFIKPQGASAVLTEPG
ncbi:hypothetical protein PO909_016539 [Leuciscus waleckii]